jgi:ABC-type branched-subunit amino acid transport system substrate-binding protein
VLTRTTKRVTGVAIVAALTMASALLVAPGAASGAPSVRGYDGKTMKIGGFGLVSQFPNADVGAQARFKEANDNNEVKNVKFEFTNYIDDKQDSATALSVARQLVTQDGVFAIVPDLSQYNPGDYLNSQHVPYFGWAFDATYCSQTATTSLYGFGFDGCLLPPNPKVVGDAAFAAYKYVSGKTGKSKPTVALFSNETDSGKTAVSAQSTSFAGAGFDVVYAKGLLPPPPLGDVTPYVQTLMSAADGDEPDLLVCLLAVDCIPVYEGLVAAGSKSLFQSPLYSDLLVKSMANSLSSVQFQPLNDSTPALDKMKAAIEDFKSGTTISSDVAIAYFSADMLIQAIKATQKAGKPITPENVQATAAKTTFGIKGLFGPTKYPASTVKPTPACNALVQSNGTTWETVEPYACSSKSFKVKASS